jgi:hypothetical protein
VRTRSGAAAATAACLSVDQLVQLATDAGSPQLTVVRDARKVPEELPDRTGKQFESDAVHRQ